MDIGENNDRVWRLPGKPNRKTIWHAPDGTTHNMSDYILVLKIYRSFFNILLTIITYSAADIVNNHNQIMTQMKAELK